MEEQDIAALYLQSILRGRNIQNQMFEGLDNMHELIQELRSIHTVQLDQKAMFEAEKNALEALAAKNREKEHKVHPNIFTLLNLLMMKRLKNQFKKILVL